MEKGKTLCTVPATLEPKCPVSSGQCEISHGGKAAQALWCQEREVARQTQPGLVRWHSHLFLHPPPPLTLSAPEWQSVGLHDAQCWVMKEAWLVTLLAVMTQ